MYDYEYDRCDARISPTRRTRTRVEWLHSFQYAVSLNDWSRFPERRGDQTDSQIYLLCLIHSSWFCKSAPIAISAASVNGNRISDWELIEVSDYIISNSYIQLYTTDITTRTSRSIRHWRLSTRPRIRLLISLWRRVKSIRAEYRNEFSRNSHA